MWPVEYCKNNRVALRLGCIRHCCFHITLFHYLLYGKPASILWRQLVVQRRPYQLRSSAHNWHDSAAIWVTLFEWKSILQPYSRLQMTAALTNVLTITSWETLSYNSHSQISDALEVPNAVLFAGNWLCDNGNRFWYLDLGSCYKKNLKMWEWLLNQWVEEI